MRTRVRWVPGRTKASVPVLIIAAIIATYETLAYFDWWNAWGWLTGNMSLLLAAGFGTAAVLLGMRVWKESHG